MNASKENSNIKVLMYHRIIKRENGRASKRISTWHAVSEENFKKQLQLIETLNFTPITFEDYQLYLENKLTLPKKPIILTFDDGHLDIFEVALPILKAFDMRAVIFAIGNRNLRYAVWDHKHEDDKCPLMTNEQILKIHEEGFEIGAHSMTHPTLSNLGQDELTEEILGSKEALEKLLGHKVISFAYPYGRFDQRARSIVAEAGYKFACGVFTGPPKFREDIFDIRRLAITYDIGSFQFLLRLLMPYEYIEWLYGKVRHRRLNEEQSENADVELPRVNYEKTMH